MMRVGIGLGSNVGDRSNELAGARRWLRSLDPAAKFSSEYETDPVGCAPETPGFRNQAAEIRWGGSLKIFCSCSRTMSGGGGEKR